MWKNTITKSNSIRQIQPVWASSQETSASGSRRNLIIYQVRDSTEQKLWSTKSTTTFLEKMEFSEALRGGSCTRLTQWRQDPRSTTTINTPCKMHTMCRKTTSRGRAQCSSVKQKGTRTELELEPRSTIKRAKSYNMITSTTPFRKSLTKRLILRLTLIR